MSHVKFDMSKLEKLNDPGRFESLNPDVMWTALGSPRPTTIVDLGAGTGLFSAKFAELSGSETVYAVDMEQRMLDWMRDNLPLAAAGRLVPILSTETSVPLADGIADLVTMINLHHELADKGATYAEALRLLSGGGQLLVVDWARRETPKGPPQSVRQTPEEVTQLLVTIGFQQAESHGGLPWHWMVTARKPLP